MMSESPIEKLEGGIEIPISLSSPSGFVTPAIIAQPSTTSPRAVILCHGFLSGKNSRTNKRLTELLVTQAITTLRFDWYGMGELIEDFSKLRLNHCTDQLDAAFTFLQQRGLHTIGLVGSSFGGLMSILSAPRYPSLQALALKCPVADFPEVLRLEFGAEALERWKGSNQIPNILDGKDPMTLHYAFFEECLTVDAYTAASHIQAPTLIVHGDQDELIPMHQIDRLLAALPLTKRLQIVRGANHQFGRPEDFRVMTTSLAKWMIDHLPFRW